VQKVQDKRASVSRFRLDGMLSVVFHAQRPNSFRRDARPGEVIRLGDVGRSAASIGFVGNWWPFVLHHVLHSLPSLSLISPLACSFAAETLSKRTAPLMQHVAEWNEKDRYVI
jgi:hypothetical protein